MPNHLTDVAASDQHAVKPWFNGRVDLSPATPNLDSLGFPLVGGRLDYVNGRAVPVVVYSRRQHVINVYTWPVQSQESLDVHVSTDHGYHVARWQGNGLELSAVSDLNARELEQFIAAYRQRQ